MDPAALLERQHPAARRQRLDVVVGEFGDLGQLLGPGLVGPDVHQVVAVREEVDRFADPDRVDVPALGPRRRLDLQGLEILDPHRPGLAAPIVPPFGVPEIRHDVRHLLAVGAQHALGRPGNRQRCLGAPVDRDSPRLADAGIRRRGPPREEHDPAAVGRPSAHSTSGRVPGQPLRLAPFDRDQVHRFGPGISSGERHPPSVGRELGVGGLALEAGQAARIAPGPIHDPDVVGVRKGDLLLADRGLPNQQRLGCRGRSEAERQSK